MADATLVREAGELRKAAAAAIAAGEVHQMADGRAGVYTGLNAAAINDTTNWKTEGQYVFSKTAGVVLLDGFPAYWDHSANAVTFRKVNDRDFYLGVIVGAATSSATTVIVDINVEVRWTIDAFRDGFLSVATGTAAAGGFDTAQDFGKSKRLMLTSTNEAQCVDMLSVDRVALGSNPVMQAILRLAANGSTSAVDITVGLANGTSTTDADAIAESLFFHMDGGDLSLFAESDDGTTEVAATDTTVDVTAGSAVANRFELWIDATNPADAKYYVDGVEVLAATSNLGNIALATGPLGLLAHIEKTSSTATGTLYVDALRLKTSED